jgi:hypothetical protein
MPFPQLPEIYHILNALKPWGGQVTLVKLFDLLLAKCPTDFDAAAVILWIKSLEVDDTIQSKMEVLKAIAALAPDFKDVAKETYEKMGELNDQMRTQLSNDLLDQFLIVSFS